MARLLLLLLLLLVLGPELTQIMAVFGSLWLFRLLSVLCCIFVVCVFVGVADLCRLIGPGLGNLRSR